MTDRLMPSWKEYFFEVTFRLGRFHVRTGPEEFMAMLRAEPNTIEHRYRTVMARAIIDTPGSLLYECPGCHRLTPVHFSRPSPAYYLVHDQLEERKVWRPIPPWRATSGTVCLWCGRMIRRGWFTHRRFVRRDDKPCPVDEETMRAVLGEPA